MGPAGSGKSTYCATMLQHCEAAKRTVHLMNLDPAAEKFEYSPAVDIRDLISLEDVMEELHLGPNGGLIYCMEYLLENLDWLDEAVGDYENDYLIIDCPGQIELYTHFPYMRSLCDHLRRLGYAICGVYVLESQFMVDKSKYFSGTLSAMSAMVQLEIPHINVMSKMDLMAEMPETELERYLNADPSLLLEDPSSRSSAKFSRLNEAIVQLVEDYNMVGFIPLNIRDEDSVEYVLSHVDNAIQFGEDQEPREPARLYTGRFAAR
ncbi:GPN-loop GTPase [Thamnocephalis sphaerospora]|uniref:GPN-loop GTPase 3 n=1 Tax=Thamnocephalis sphaerospora TaxID=78915 RepID=A0A4P9XV99_9FUNG|nr:GPN-loop GTPase [Thamnocephalis sphaerospora]|eukprot:RKP10197.1 GPN-loop GTPase [Thamnocephalis sphaerospora]